MYPELSLHIDGRWCKGSDGKSEPVIDPATESEIGSVPHASKDDLDRALESARKAFDLWRRVPAVDRGKVLKNAAQLMRDRLEDIARALTLEQGKPLQEARAETLFAADVIEWYAEEGKRAYGRVVPARAQGLRQMVLSEPVGPSLALSPWNFPATLAARKIAGALAAGCSCIIKPSEETPATAIAIARVLEESGLPPGVLNVVFGVPAEVSEHLIASPVIRKVSFTGSIPVGKHLARLAADGVKKCTLELGGNAPLIVFSDADAERSAELAAVGKYRNAGQVCISPSRFFVHEAVHDRFVQRYSDISRSLRVGPGLEDGIEIGALANARRLDAMERLVADARDRGAKVLCGGKRVGNRGFFFEPTVLTDVEDEADVMAEEVFGPVTPVVRFSDFDDVVRRANAVPQGLAAYAFSRSAETCAAIADALSAGMIGINHTMIFTPETPFGGVKESGYGSEGGIEGLEAYMDTKLVSQAGMS